MPENDSHYTVLARRFRPQTFAEIAGQEHVGQALRNAIRSGRVAHAYLFTGARGVGKTSTARIFAKALNCPHAVDGVPCNACEVCRSIAAGNDVDVLEIDGASNRGIDDVRTLRANVTVRSMRSPYKVYIIDEVHMLTREAFNALLKTLEEPPPNVKFVFCTTEPGKVPDTILSRCQRFDFGLIDASTIAARLRQIAEAEQVEIDADALELLARRAAGSLRDAQSLLDQLFAFGSERLTAADVHRLLGSAPDDLLVSLGETLVRADTAGALAALDAALAAGVQIGSLSDQLVEYLRDLLVAGLDADDVGLLSVSGRRRADLHRQAAEWGLESIAAAMQILAETKNRMQRVTYGRALLELAIIRICLLERLDELADLVRTLRETPTSGGEPAAPLPRPRPASARTASAVEPAKKNDRADSGNPEVLSVNPEDLIESVVTTEPVEKVPVSEDTLQAFWNKVLETVSDSIAQHLRNAGRVAISGPNGLEIVFPARYSFSRAYCQRAESLRRLEAVAREIAGCEVRVDIRPDEESPGTAPDPEPRIPRPSAPDAVRNDPFVQQVIAIFGGSIVEVRSTPPILRSET